MAGKLAGWSLGLALMGAAPAFSEEIVVVVHRNAPVSELTAQEVREIYVGERAYWGGTRINPVAYGNSRKVQGDFLRRLLKTDPNAYKQYWIRRIFREGGVPPARTATEVDLVTAVAATEGGIGFLYASELAGQGDRVKVGYRIPD